MAGYLVRPFHPIVALLVIAALATFLRFGAFGKRKTEAQPGAGEQVEPAPASAQPEAGSVRAGRRLAMRTPISAPPVRDHRVRTDNLLDTFVLIGPETTATGASKSSRTEFSLPA